MGDRPIIRIDYDEFAPETYRGVRLQMPSRPNQELVLQESRGPVYDLRAAIDVALTEGRPMFMSSVDHFISDLPLISEQREDLAQLRDKPETALQD